MHGTWTTKGIAEREQFSYWRDAVCEAFVPMEPEGRPESFTGRIEALSGQNLQLASVAADGHPVNLTRRGVNRQADTSFFANLVVRGSIFVEQFGARGQVDPGDIFLLDTAAPFTIHFASDFRLYCITLDEAALRPRLGRGGRPASPVIRGDSGVGRVTAQYMRNLISETAETVLDLQDLAAPHLAALLARASAGEGLAEGPAVGSLERIQAFIEAHLGEPELSVQSTCEALRMSRSHVYNVLSAAGLTFAGYLRDCRLEECRRAIAAQPERSIAEIAFAWGFRDQSSFARSFKSRFGITPRQARA